MAGEWLHCAISYVAVLQRICADPVQMCRLADRHSRPMATQSVGLRDVDSYEQVVLGMSMSPKHCSLQDVLLLGWSSCSKGRVLFGSCSRAPTGKSVVGQVEADYSKVDQRVSTDGYIGVEVHFKAT